MDYFISYVGIAKIVFVVIATAILTWNMAGISLLGTILLMITNCFFMGYVAFMLAVIEWDELEDE